MFRNLQEGRGGGEGGGLYNHLTSSRIFFTTTMHKIFIRDPKIMRKIATDTIWIVFRDARETGAEIKSDHITTATYGKEKHLG